MRFPPTLLLLTLLASPPIQAQDLPCPLRFTDIAAEAGVVFEHRTGARGDKHLPETMGAGIAWLDFDGDGVLDLFAAQSGDFPPDPNAPPGDRLWRGRGDGTFEDWTERAGLTGGPGGYGQGVLATDLDGDGHDDLYLARFGRDVLLRNRGDGTFEDVTARYSIEGASVGGWSSSVAAADADHDGDLDLYVTGYLLYDPADELFCGDFERGERTYCDPSLFEGAPDRLLLWDAEARRYVDGTVAAGLGGARGKGLGVVFTDLDDDGHADLYVANDLTENLLYRGRGDGTFEDLSLLSGVGANREGKYEAGMGIAVGDVDGDLDLDLAVSNFDVETNTLYRNLGGLFFEDASASSGFGVPSFNLLGFGIAFADLDLDADLDVWVANGHIFEQPKRRTITHAQHDLILLGDGGGSFTSIDCGWLMPRVGRGLAVGDMDGDGDVDVAVSNNGGVLQLWRNEGLVAGRGGTWLGVALRGARVGARVVLTDDTGRRQARRAQAGESYQSTHAANLRFGLGAAAPRRLDITWSSGRRWAVENPPANRELVVRGR